MSLFPSLLDQRNFFNPFESGNTLMEWKETCQSHIFEIDLPGLTKDDVKLEIREGRVIRLCAERRDETDEKGDKWHCKERIHGNFLRQFRLPENAKVDDIKASMHDGVLIVTVPKDELKKKPKHKVPVEIAGQEERASKGLSRFICFKA